MPNISPSAFSLLLDDAVGEEDQQVAGLGFHGQLVVLGVERGRAGSPARDAQVVTLTWIPAARGSLRREGLPGWDRGHGGSFCAV